MFYKALERDNCNSISTLEEKNKHFWKIEVRLWANPYLSIGSKAQYNNFNWGSRKDNIFEQIIPEFDWL